MRTKPGAVFVFEGPDGVGKSTIASAFADELRSRGRTVFQDSSPGKTEGTLGELVYRLHHEPRAIGISTLSQTALQVLHVAAHIDTIEREIRPRIEAGEDVVLDRSWFSTLAYGRVLGIDTISLQHMIALEHASWSSLRPQTTFFVSSAEPRPPEVDLGFWRKLVMEYSQLLEEYGAHWSIVALPNEGKLQSAVEAALRFAPDAHKSTSTGGSRGPRPSHDLRPAKTTDVYDTYWRFAAERQRVLFARLRGDYPPYTQDSIISRYRFTNAYRAADRVSQYLIQHVIEGSEDDPSDLFFRIILFKTFNKIETWEALTDEIGDPHWAEFDFSCYDKLLSDLRRRGHSIYSAAYIMPSGGKAFGFRWKHQNHLALLAAMLREGVPERVAAAASMKEVFDILCSYPMIGPFLGYQYATDINYSPLTDFSEMEFVIPGPGAKDGIRKCFSDLGGLTEAEIIRLVTERQDEEFAARGLVFRRLGSRPLQLIDCQNLFCEVDKYARVAHPDVPGISGRTRIKQQYRPDPRPLMLVLPKKWNTTLQKECRKAHDAGLLFG